MLDLYAGPAHQAHLEHYRGRFRAWREALDEMDAIRSEEKMTEEEIDYARTQLAHMDALDLSDEGIATLERDFKKKSSAHELGELLASLDSALGGESGLTERLAPLLRTAHATAELDPGTAELEQRLHALAVELADIHSDYARLGAGIAVANDPATQEALAMRMNHWLELRRKHGPAPATVRAKRDAISQRLARQTNIAATLENAAAAAAKIEDELHHLARGLHATRAAAATTLSTAATLMLAKLGFKKATLRLHLDATARLDATGGTTAEFLFQPNAGQDLLPLNKIASSGETARVMLALKTVLANADQTPVLVFDEVDSNIAGETGAQVGRELAALSARHQVFCVTHLPQVAAQGHHHFEVLKSQTDEDTTVTIHPLHTDPAAREAEIARMLGDRQGVTARTHARQLLSCKPPPVPHREPPHN
jgi:DNA repair protein RecN (Recombination protein N)